MRYYKTLIDEKAFNNLYKEQGITLDTFDLYNEPWVQEIPSICDICGKPFVIQKAVMKKRLNRTEYYGRISNSPWTCMEKECVSKKKAQVCVDRMLTNEESIKKRLDAADKRLGMTYEEQYGKEKAEEIKAIIRQKRKEQPEPMLGKHHSDKSKLLMSLRKREQCTSKTYVHKTLSGSNKGHVLRWYDNKEIFYQSSYEKKYIELLNQNKKYFDRCNIVLPYTWDGNNRHYNPDFTIFKDKEHKSISHIVEVKPKTFTNDSTYYGEWQLVKLNALETFCRYNNYIKVLITEEELNENKIY